MIIVPTLVRSEVGKPEPLSTAHPARTELRVTSCMSTPTVSPPDIRWYCGACAEQINWDSAFTVAQPQALAGSADKS